MKNARMMGRKGRVSDGDRSFDRAFWSSATPEEPGLSDWIDLLAAFDASGNQATELRKHPYILWMA